MEKEINYFCCHFHKVDSLTWLAVRTMLQNVLVKRVEAGTDKVVFEVSQDDFQVISDFLFDMDVAYLHPRRDAMHVSLLASQYSNIKLPARAAIFSQNSKDVSRAPRARFASSSREFLKGSESFPRAPRASSPANLS